jgi:hypothetical protein
MPIGYQSHGGVLSLRHDEIPMTRTDGRNATKPYRVRVGGTWYWVDPTARDFESGDTVLIYTRDGQSALAVLRAPLGDPAAFASLEAEPFDLARADIAALHLAAVDEVQ